MEQLAGFPEMPLSEIANACGYATQSLFGRHFLKVTGMTPGKFRHTHAGRKPQTHVKGFHGADQGETLPPHTLTPHS